MKILHTGDFHAGKTLHGLDRTPEIADALEQIATIAIDNAVDVVLVAGDLFDTRNPSAAAEQAVYSFISRLSAHGISIVGAGGNHDSPKRIEALNRLTLDGHDCNLLGIPRAPDEGGRVRVEAVASYLDIYRLPFISHRQVVDFLESEDGLADYNARMGRLLATLTRDLDPRNVNLLIAHGTVDGATLAGSEYTFHSGLDYAFDLESVNEDIDYIALGHIHKAQWVGNRARYCGSIIPLDFGETDQKSVTLIEATPVKGGWDFNYEVLALAHRRMVTIEETIETLEEEYTNWEPTEDAHVKVVVEADRTQGIRERVRDIIPDALIVQVKQRDEDVFEDSHQNPASLSLTEAFVQYADPSDEELETFKELLEEVTHHEAS